MIVISNKHNKAQVEIELRYKMLICYLSRQINITAYFVRPGKYSFPPYLAHFICRAFVVLQFKLFTI